MNQLMSDLSQNSIVVSPNKLWGKPLNLESGAFLKRVSFKNTGKRDWGLQKVKVGNLTELVLLSFRSKKHTLLSDKAWRMQTLASSTQSCLLTQGTVQEAHLLNPTVWSIPDTNAPVSRILWRVCIRRGVCNISSFLCSHKELHSAPAR